MYDFELFYAETRLECLDLAIKSGAADAVDTAKKFYDFVMQDGCSEEAMPEDVDAGESHKDPDDPFPVPHIKPSIIFDDLALRRDGANISIECRSGTVADDFWDWVYLYCSARERGIERAFQRDTDRPF